jgi:hypothetical protein
MDRAAGARREERRHGRCGEDSGSGRDLRRWGR